MNRPTHACDRGADFVACNQAKLPAMARSHGDLWLWLGGTTAAAVGAVCLGVALTVDQTRAHYDLWTSQVMIGAYVAFGFAIICFFCAVFDVPIPLVRSRDQPALSLPAQPTASPLAAHPVVPDAATPVLSATPGQQTEVRTFTDATLADLVKPFRTHSSIQARKLVRPYVGQWLLVDGRVGDVSPDWDNLALISLQPKVNLASVTLHFSDRMVVEQQLSVLKRGSQISAVGKIRSISGSWIDLEDCELVSVSSRWGLRR